MRGWKLVLGVVLFCLVIGVLVLIPYRFSLPQNDLAGWSSLGTWLQGVLTPLLLLVAIGSFWYQSESVKAQTRAQADANQIAQRAFFLDNSRKFTGHINYRCICALVNGEPADNPNARGLTVMVALLRGAGAEAAKLIDSLPNYEILDLNQVRRGRQFALLKRDIDQVINLGERCEMEGLLDGRVVQIQSLILENPPIPSA
jgi:hypothetical protein